jgi:hypothetical protein
MRTTTGCASGEVIYALFWFVILWAFSPILALPLLFIILYYHRRDV